MNQIILQQPRRLVFGSGCATQCTEDIVRGGFRRVLLVTSSAVLDCIGKFVEQLRSGKVAVDVFAGVNTEPDIALFGEALARAGSFEPNAVLGIGGGSAMDVAKLVAALAGSEQRIEDVFGINLLAGRKLFLACLPTTAGTGSEVSPNAILLDEREQLKKGVVSPHLVPDAAYVDPLLTVSVPPAVTAATGLDALVHCIEAYANKFAHPIVDLYALEGIRLIGASLERAVRNGGDIEARERMALGSLYGGLCLGPVNTAAVHALAYPLGGEFHVAHGVSNAVLLPHVLRFNLPAAAERYAQIAVALGVSPGSSPLDVARRGIERLVELSRRCGLPQRLSELGVPEEAIPRMARSAMTVTRLLKNNVRQLTESDAVEVYRSAL